MAEENPKNKAKNSITILIDEGLVPPEVMVKVQDLASRYGLQIYLSTMQNLRLLDMQDEDMETIKQELVAVGARIKGPGIFPLARLCVGSGYCSLGMTDTLAFSARITEKFKERKVKPKFKIGLSGCPASCSNPLISDIGIKSTKSGYEVTVGGKGGTRPSTGRRIAKGLDEDEVLEIIEKLVDLHDQKAGKKMRMHKLLSDPDFPFEEL